MGVQALRFGCWGIQADANMDVSGRSISNEKQPGSQTVYRIFMGAHEGFIEFYSGLIEVHAPVVVWFVLWVCGVGFVERLWKGYGESVRGV